MARLTVIGNLCVDSVDGGALRPGGCPTFVGYALQRFAGDGEVLTRCADRDRPLFEGTLAALGVPVAVLPAAATSAFRMHYTGDHRAMTVEAIGDTWTPAELATASTTDWAHVAPVLRSDFSAEALEALAAGGCRVSLDGQGLVRRSALGPLVLDRSYEPALLDHVQALKLSEEEAGVLFPGGIDAESVDRLGVPEVLLTLGSAGYVVFTEGAARQIRAPRPVLGVQATGAGDVFMVGYGAARCAGAEPFEAAGSAGELVAQMLEQRKRDG